MENAAQISKPNAKKLFSKSYWSGMKEKVDTSAEAPTTISNPTLNDTS